MHIKRPPKTWFIARSWILCNATPQFIYRLPTMSNTSLRRTGARVPKLMSDAQQQDITLKLRDALVASFTGKDAERRLADALRDGSPWIIDWIAYGGRDDHTALPFDRWPEFSCVLLTLAESRPVIGCPLIVGLVTKTDMRSTLRQSPEGETEEERGWVGEFDREAAKRLFDYPRLMQLLSKFEVPEYLDEQMKASCLAAVDAARAEVNVLKT